MLEPVVGLLSDFPAQPTGNAAGLYQRRTEPAPSAVATGYRARPGLAPDERRRPGTGLKQPVPGRAALADSIPQGGIEGAQFLKLAED